MCVCLTNIRHKINRQSDAGMSWLRSCFSSILRRQGGDWMLYSLHIHHSPSLFSRSLSTAHPFLPLCLLLLCQSPRLSAVFIVFFSLIHCLVFAIFSLSLCLTLSPSFRQRGCGFRVGWPSVAGDGTLHKSLHTLQKMLLKPTVWINNTDLISCSRTATLASVLQHDIAIKCN